MSLSITNKAYHKLIYCSQNIFNYIDDIININKQITIIFKCSYNYMSITCERKNIES